MVKLKTPSQMMEEAEKEANISTCSEKGLRALAKTIKYPLPPGLRVFEERKENLRSRGVSEEAIDQLWEVAASLGKTTTASPRYWFFRLSYSVLQALYLTVGIRLPDEDDPRLKKWEEEETSES